jgi:hypothetical protein
MYGLDRTDFEVSLTLRGTCTPQFSIAGINLLNAELNPIRHLLALTVAHHFVNVSRVRVKKVNYIEQ